MNTNTLGDLIARNLKLLLEEKQIPETRLARDAGMAHTVVRDIISRKTKNPAFATLVRIAKAAGVDVDRITVGPDYATKRKADQDILDLLNRLTPEERQTLISVAKERLAAREMHSD
jgi:transcriptional regulator with XRE-family HTH domain